MRLTPISTRLATEIESRIRTYPDGPLRQIVEASLDDARQAPLAIKYVPTKWAKTYLKPSARLKVSTTPGFTWGTGTYVTPLAFPISSAIFGRLGVVAEFEPTGWRVFDATDPVAQSLYLAWLQSQPLYRVLTLTMHSQLANQFLRDLFRATYRIDCVLFRPDQANPFYTDATDIWMNVTDWTSTGEISSDFSERLRNPRLVVLAEEEFEPTEYDVGRQALIGPLSLRPDNGTVQAKIAQAYRSRTLVRLLA